MSEASPASQYPPSRHIWFGAWTPSNVPDIVDMFDMFSEFGTLENLVVKNSYGFVNYTSVSSACAAKEHLHGLQLRRYNLLLYVRFARGTPNRVVWVGGLGPTVSRSDLLSAFSRCGPIDHIKICSTGQAYLWFNRSEDAIVALDMMQDVVISGSKISVDFAIDLSRKNLLERDLQGVLQKRGLRDVIENDKGDRPDQTPLLTATEIGEGPNDRSYFASASSTSTGGTTSATSGSRSYAPDRSRGERETETYSSRPTDPAVISSSTNTRTYERPREERSREDRPRERSTREDRPREERPREERSREGRPRDNQRSAPSTDSEYEPSKKRTKVAETSTEKSDGQFEPMPAPASPRTDILPGGVKWLGTLSKAGISLCRAQALLVGGSNCYENLPSLIDMNKQTNLTDVANFIPENPAQEPSILLLLPSGLEHAFQFDAIYHYLHRVNKAGVCQPKDGKISIVYLIPMELAIAKQFGVTDVECPLFMIAVPTL